MIESQIDNPVAANNDLNQMDHHEHHKRNIIVVSFLALIIFISLLVSLQIVSNRQDKYTQTTSEAKDATMQDLLQPKEIDPEVKSSFQELDEDTANFKMEIEDLEQPITLLEEPSLDINF